MSRSRFEFTTGKSRAAVELAAIAMCHALAFWSAAIIRRFQVRWVKPRLPAQIALTKDTGRYARLLRPRLTGSGRVSGAATGNGGGGFDLRFNLSRNTRCAFRPGEAPRTDGFSISALISRHFASLAVTFFRLHWRHRAVRLSCGDGFGDDRTTRTYH